MAARDHLSWPFFEDHHRRLGQALDDWAATHVAHAHGDDVDAECRALANVLGGAGWLAHAVGGTAHGGAAEAIDTRSIVLVRETLARYSGLADFAFAMQGLGSDAISLAGTPAQKERYLPRVARGEAIAAFALSEPEAGSDVAALLCAARADGDHYVLDGEKTWISNGGIADFYVVFARTGEAAGARGISAFIVEAGTPGFEIAERIDVIAPHPLARLRFTNSRIPASQRVGAAAEWFKVAMRTLDVFRTSVAGAALGFARRALAEGLQRAATRRMFGQTLADFQLTQAKLAQMAITIDSAALLTYRAAWPRDQGRNVTREAAMAKLAATEGAQQVIDGAVQLWGGLGVVSEQPVERLYREIRALRIYEGATEVQLLIIARELLLDQQLTDEERAVREAAAAYCQEKLAPRVLDAFRHEKPDTAIFREMGEIELLGPTIAEAYGGPGLNYVNYGLIAREVERADSGYRSMMSVQSSLVMVPIFEFANEETKQKYLPKLAAGAWVGCFGLTEPSHGSDPGGMVTRARPGRAGGLDIGVRPHTGDVALTRRPAPPVAVAQCRH